MTSQGLSVLNPFAVCALPECSLSGLSEPERRLMALAPSDLDTHVDAKPECGDSGGLTQGQQQQEQGREQLHQVEEVVVDEEVGRQRDSVLGVGEELVVILAFLRKQEPGGRASLPDTVASVGRGEREALSRSEGIWARDGRRWKIESIIFTVLCTSQVSLLPADGARKIGCLPKTKSPLEESKNTESERK